MKLVLEIAPPDPLLNPNRVKRAPWYYGRRAEMARRSKESGFAATELALRKAGLRPPITAAGHVILDVEWRLGFRRRALDDDNAIAMLKPARDGIAEALGVDDRVMRVGQLNFVRSASQFGSLAITLSWE